MNADVLFLRGDHEAAAKKYYADALNGDARASFNYAYCLFYGIGVQRNQQEAKSFFSYARDLEGGESCYNLAMMYMHGEGVRRDYRESFRYMKISAEQGCIEAQLYLGMVYTTGYLIEPDVVFISLIPYHKPQYRDLSVPLIAGDVLDAEVDEEARFSVTSADARLAFEWFRIAAHHDPTYVADLVAKGQYLYAKCYIDGMGTDFNRTLGAKIMLAAGKSGSLDAVNYLKENGITASSLLENEKIKRRRSNR